MTGRLCSRKQRAFYLVFGVVCISIFFLSTSYDSAIPPYSLRDLFPDTYAFDSHPISELIRNANTQWEEYEKQRSKTFRETLAKYRHRYGRHPPPGFMEWYKFARKRKVHNIDDFGQIVDDLRPFWATEPSLLRQMAASLSHDGDGMGGIHIREKKIAKLSHPSWRIETLAALISKMVRYLPDMDIAVNVQDQPRIAVRFEDIQQRLTIEQKSMQLNADAKDHFTEAMDHLLNLTQAQDHWDGQTDPQWFSPPDHQFMEVVKTACPPDSPARVTEMSVEDADRLYKTQLGGFVSNFSLSTDLCTVGPAIKDQHGFLFSAASLVVSQKLLPVFSECKTSVNNDILFPANMYTKKDARYEYDAKFDLRWRKKTDTLLWRGVTSGGVSTEGNWQRLHRQRLVLLTNATLNHNGQVSILSENADGGYEPTSDFNASDFAQNHFDVGFTEHWACDPFDCPFYNGILGVKNQVSLSEQFKSKYLVDVDGHSFSGRWRAFHFGRSLGIKATIFREWHDSRLFAWRHFIPMDNRYDDLYSLMTYFIGAGQTQKEHTHREEQDVAYIHSHDLVGKMIASQSRDWANQVLRHEDIEIYMFLLLLEYGRIMDDNRDKIGYSGDGSELDEFDKKY